MPDTPRFADAANPAIAPDWLKAGLDVLFSRAGHAIESVQWFFHATSGYGDEGMWEDRHGTVSIIWRDGVARPTEEDLDEIPAMRLLERKADAVAQMLPLRFMESDGDPMIDGDVVFQASIGLIEYSAQDSDGENDLRIASEHVDGTWRDIVELVCEWRGSCTDLLTTDHAHLFAHSVDLKAVGLKEVPTILDVHHDAESPGQITFRIDPVSYKDAME